MRVNSFFAVLVLTLIFVTSPILAAQDDHITFSNEEVKLDGIRDYPGVFVQDVSCPPPIDSNDFLLWENWESSLVSSFYSLVGGTTAVVAGTALAMIPIAGPPLGAVIGTTLAVMIPIWLEEIFGLPSDDPGPVDIGTSIFTPDGQIELLETGHPFGVLAIINQRETLSESPRLFLQKNNGGVIPDWGNISIDDVFNEGDWATENHTNCYMTTIKTIFTIQTPGEYRAIVYHPDGNCEGVKFEVVEDETCPYVTSYRYEQTTDSPVTLFFSEQINEYSIDGLSVGLVGSISGAIPSSLDYDPIEKSIEIYPDYPWQYGETVEIFCNGQLMDLGENLLCSSFSAEFQIFDSPQPSATGIDVGITVGDNTISGGGTISLDISCVYSFNGTPSSNLVPVGTAVVSIGGNSSTVPIVDGEGSANITAPTQEGNFSLSVSVSDGFGRTGSGSLPISVSQEIMSGVVLDVATICTAFENNSDDTVWVGDERNYYNLDDQNDIFSVVQIVPSGSIFGKAVYPWYRLYDPDGNIISQYNDFDYARPSWGVAWWAWGGGTLYEPGRYTVAWDFGDDGQDYDRAVVKSFVFRYNLLQHRMTQSVMSEPPFDPINPGNIFLNTTPTVATWAQFEWVSEDFGIKWEWIDPDGNVDGSYIVNPISSGDWYGGSFSPPYENCVLQGFIDVNGTSRMNKCGVWTVKVYITNAWGDFEEAYVDHFSLLEETPPNVSILPPGSTVVAGAEYIVPISATDNSHLDSVSLKWELAGNTSSQNWDVANQSTFEQNPSITIPDQAGSIIGFWGTAVDESENESSSNQHNLLIVPEAVIGVLAPVVSDTVEVNSLVTVNLVGGVSTAGHDLEFQMDWGDGTFSDWVTDRELEYEWGIEGEYNLKCRARCSVHNSVLSEWSETAPVFCKPDASISVLLPNGGEIWTEGQEQQISWTSLNCGSTVGIYLLQDDVPCQTISASAQNTGSFNYSVNRCSVETGSYRIQIKDLESGISDNSDGEFEIQPFGPGSFCDTSPFILNTNRIGFSQSQPTALTNTPDESETPLRTALGSPYPNPFNPMITIPFSIRKPGKIEVNIYDLRGRRVTQLVHGDYEAGWYEHQWNGRNERGSVVAAGIYLVRIKSAEDKDIKKITLLK